MSTDLPPTNSNELPQVRKIVSSYLKRNRLSYSDIEALSTALREVVCGYLPEDIHFNQSTSIKVETLATPEPPEAQLRFTDLIKQPAVPIEDSIYPDFIICLEDGAQVKSLGPYIKSRYALTPAQYREKWGLPAKYPMTAPNYAKKRSVSAKEALESSQETEVPSNLAVDTLHAASETLTINTEPTNSVDLEHPDSLVSEDLHRREIAPASEEKSIINADENSASTAVTSIEMPVQSAFVPEITDQKPPQKSRPILKLAAWQKPPAPDISAEGKTSEQPAPSHASKDAPQEEAAPAPVDKTSQPLQENSSRGFRYPVHRYSR